MLLRATQRLGLAIGAASGAARSLAAAAPSVSSLVLQHAAITASPAAATLARGVVAGLQQHALGRLGGAAAPPPALQAAVRGLVGSRFSVRAVCGGSDLLGAARGLSGGGLVGRRALSGGSEEEVFVYESISESHVKSMALVSMAQVGICAIVAGLVVFHPQAATSAMLPGWSFEGRASLGACIVAFGGFFAMGTKGFLSKQVLRIATLKNDPDNLHVYTFQYPASLQCSKVPRKEFYAITAAYQEIDLEKESKEAFIMPMYVGGPLRQTLIIDLRGHIHDKEVMHELLTKAAQELAKQGDWGDEKEEKKTFVPNKYRKKL